MPAVCAEVPGTAADFGIDAVADVGEHSLMKPNDPRRSAWTIIARDTGFTDAPGNSMMSLIN
jgi:hypothetical protein